MQVTVELAPEIKQRLAVQAQALGVALESYIESLLVEQTSMPGSIQGQSEEQFRESLDALTRYSEKIPALPLEALSRESLYQDYD